MNTNVHLLTGETSLKNPMDDLSYEADRKNKYGNQKSNIDNNNNNDDLQIYETESHSSNIDEDFNPDLSGNEHIDQSCFSSSNYAVVKNVSDNTDLKLDTSQGNNLKMLFCEMRLI